MKRLLPLALCGLCLCAAPLQARDELFDAAKDYAGARDLLTDGVRPLEGRNPWANAPFLTLRYGDALFVARLWHRGLKGDDGRFSSEEKVVLLTRDGLHEVGTIRDNRAILNQSALIFFDWDVTLENAAFLENLDGKSDGMDLSLAQYQAIVDAIQPSFASAVRDAATPRVAPPHFEVISKNNDANALMADIIPPSHIKGTGEQRIAVLERLRYHRYSNEVEHQRYEIGQGIYRVTTHTFIAGPRHMEAYEIEDKPIGRFGMNNGTVNDPAVMRAQYKAMLGFEALVQAAVPELKPIAPKEFGKR